MEEPKKTTETNEGDADVGSLERKETVAKPLEAVPKAKVKKKLNLKTLATRLNIYFLLFVFIILVAILVVFLAVWKTNQAEKKTIATTTITGETITPEELAKLKSGETKLGDPQQVLNIEANTSFSGSILVKGSLDVAGTIKVGSSLSLPGITVSGTSSFDQISAKNLSISGDTSIQGGLSVKNNSTFNGNLTVGGNLTAGRLTISTLQIDGDAVINRHIDAGGSTPDITNGTAVGAGGTVSISGTDTAGTVTVNTGNTPVAGVLAYITFTNAFHATPHVVIAPVGSGGSAIAYYVTRTANGFTISTSTAAPAGQSFSFDYIAID